MRLGLRAEPFVKEPDEKLWSYRWGTRIRRHHRRRFPGRCGEKPAPSQRRAYRAAHDFIQELASKLRPGSSYADLARDLPDYPDAYREQRYPYVLHGVGTDDEPPFLAFPDEPGVERLDGEFREDMVVSVEFYAGEAGGQDGVKLEDEVWIGPDGPVVLSLYPYDERLLS